MPADPGLSMARMCDWKFRRDECLRLARVIADVCDDWVLSLWLL